jgi:hypothetical protein
MTRTAKSSASKTTNSNTSLKTGAVFDEIQREKILNGLQAARETTDAFIEKAQVELKSKGDLYKKLSMLGGIALIIITL